jgi:hypothetical protein
MSKLNNATRSVLEEEEAAHKDLLNTSQPKVKLKDPTEEVEVPLEAEEDINVVKISVATRSPANKFSTTATKLIGQESNSTTQVEKFRTIAEVEAAKEALEVRAEVAAVAPEAPPAGKKQDLPDVRT